MGTARILGMYFEEIEMWSLGDRDRQAGGVRQGDWIVCRRSCARSMLCDRGSVHGLVWLDDCSMDSSVMSWIINPLPQQRPGADAGQRRLQRR